MKEGEDFLKKYKYLMKNISILTISNLGSKFLVFLLIPLYTNVLTTKEYGAFDFINTTILFLIPIFTLNISEASLRFLLDKKNKKSSDICSITFKFSLFSIIIMAILLIINHYLNIISIINLYLPYFIIYYTISVLYVMLQNVARGLSKIKELAISGILNSILVLSLNISFLVFFKLGLKGYFFANIIAVLITVIYLLIKTKFISYINLKITNKSLEKEMIKYSKPMMINSVSWWINNVSDRYIVTYLCGFAANGVYSIAYKVPAILVTFQDIFTQSWWISAIKEFDKTDSDNFFKNVYTSYNIFVILCCSFLIMISKIFAYFFFRKDFYISWRYMPFLLIAIVFGALSGLLGGIFSAVKDTKTLGFTTTLGAAINIVLNFILILYIGVMGAAISTFLSYFIVWLVRIIKAKKWIVLKINFKKDFIAYLMLLVQALILLNINNVFVLYSLQLILFSFLILLYKKEIYKLIKKIIITLNRKKQNIVGG